MNEEHWGEIIRHNDKISIAEMKNEAIKEEEKKRLYKY